MCGIDPPPPYLGRHPYTQKERALCLCAYACIYSHTHTHTHTEPSLFYLLQYQETIIYLRFLNYTALHFCYDEKKSMFPTLMSYVSSLKDICVH